MKKTGKILKIVLPLLLGGGILYWMYRDFDFRSLSHVLLSEMDWTWMLLSFPFGIMAQVLRGWRWQLSLAPLGEHPRKEVAVNSIFLSYASSLAVPRIGEFMRCGVLRRWDGVSFAKALGTVVTERAIDSLLVMAITGLTLLFGMRTFSVFFEQTGTTLQSVVSRFSLTGYLVLALCGAALLILLYFLVRHLAIYHKVKTTLGSLWEGVASLRNVKGKWLFAAMTVGIWLSYFLHYYLTFFCFPFTSHLGLGCAMVTFVVGSIAVVVPTPNGAGPWHFAIKTMLILYGVADNEALYFVLIVHAVQTMLVVLLGIWAWIRLWLTARRPDEVEAVIS